MTSSNSSGFEKDLTATRAFDLDDRLQDSPIEVVQAIDEFDLEQSCLIRLKNQRQKIEELTKLYLQKQKELETRLQQEKKLQEEVERLSDLTEYKKSFAELKRDYDSLKVKEELTSQECEALKKQFDQAIIMYQEQEEALKAEIKYHKEQRLLSEANWESIIADKQEQLKKQMRAGQEKEEELLIKLSKLQQQLQIAHETMEEKGTELQSTQFTLQGQLKQRHEEIVNYDKLVECMRRQLSDYKNRFISAEDEWQKQKDTLCEMVEQMKSQLRLLKKDQLEKENEIYQYKEIIKRFDQKNQTLEENVSSLRSNIKKVKDTMGTSIKKLANSSQEEKCKLELFVQELKAELQRQMDEKSALMIQVKRLRGCIERKDQQQKQRKLLLMSEFREIDKMQKMVKKVI